MYESPINLSVDKIAEEIKKNLEECIIIRSITRCGIIIDKDQLIKALTYDRDQYQKGYADAKAEQSWVPCEEKLPGYGERVLISGTRGGVCIAEMGTLFGKPAFWVQGSKTVKALAWMPLPNPYPHKGKEAKE